MQAPLTPDDLLIHAVVTRIFQEIPVHMTANLRLQHLGIYTIISILIRRGEAPTTNNIANATGIHPSQVGRMANLLAEYGLVERSVIHASHGKGRLNLYIPITDIRRVADFVPLKMKPKAGRRADND